jgi:predicted exporter
LKFTWRRAGAAACWLWLAACCVFLAVRFSGPAPIDSDILSMLPGAGKGVESDGIALASKAAAGRVAVLVSAQDDATAGKAADDLVARLGRNGLFVSDTSDAPVTARWVFENRNQVLCQRNPAAFDAAAAQKIARRAVADVYSVTGAVTGDLLRQDPFLLTIRLSECLPPEGATLTKPNQRLVSGRISTSAYRLDAQDEIVADFDGWRAEWAPQGVTAARAGAVFHAHDAAAHAKQDFSWIGAVGLIGCALLIYGSFRTIASVVQGLTIVFISLAPGLAVALMIFPTVHVLVFVFASTLIGIVSDYAINVLATGPASDWAPLKDRLAMAGRPLTVSMVTITLGYGALAVFGVPLFQQVAALASVGIVTAWAFALLVLAPMGRRPPNAEARSAWWRKIEAAREAIRIPPVVVWSIIAVLAAVSIYGATRIRFLDDVRQFQPKQVELMAEEDAVKAAGYGGTTVTFLLSEGATAEEAKQREEAALAEAPAAARILSSTRFDPSQKRRAENEAALKTQLYGPLLAAHLATLGVEPSVDLANLAPPADVAKPSWLAELSGHAHGRFFLVAPVLDAAGWKGPDAPGAKIVDPAAAYTTAFAAYRNQAILALLVAAACAIVATLLVYRRLSALTILVPSALAAAMALLIPAAFGYRLTFFSFAAALVLVGDGVDYAAFQWEGGLRRQRWTAVAVALDAATTLLSVGLLSLSDTVPVQSFGLTVTIGIAAALCLSHIPKLAAMKRPRPEEAPTP